MGYWLKVSHFVDLMFAKNSDGSPIVLTLPTKPVVVESAYDITVDWLFILQQKSL